MVVMSSDANPMEDTNMSSVTVLSAIVSTKKASRLLELDVLDFHHQTVKMLVICSIV
jgi:hypothetical protein